MHIPELGEDGDLMWQLFHNKNGYFESAKKFDELIETVKECDTDFENQEITEELIEESDLTVEDKIAMTAFTHLTTKFAAQFVEDDIEELKSHNASNTLAEYLDE